MSDVLLPPTTTPPQTAATGVAASTVLPPGTGATVVPPPVPVVYNVGSVAISPLDESTLALLGLIGSYI